MKKNNLKFQEMLKLQLDSVLKNQQINDAQREKIRTSLSKSKYSKLKYNNTINTTPIVSLIYFTVFEFMKSINHFYIV